MPKPFYRISSKPDYYEIKARKLALLCPIDCTNDRLANRIQCTQKIVVPPVIKPKPVIQLRPNVMCFNENITLNFN